MRLFFIFFLILQIKSFNINNFIYHARLCKLTYKTYNNTFIIVHKNNSLNICFRGTKNMNDIYLNFNIIQKSFIKKEIKVHRGFLNKYLSIRDKVINKTNEIISNNNIEDIYISGHSSGGAIANIASLDLYYLYPNIRINTITFGAPKMANKAFVEEYNNKINNSIRIVNKYDIFQYLPLSIPIIYHHIHKPIILLDNVKKINIIYNHEIKTYIKNLIIFNIR